MTTNALFGHDALAKLFRPRSIAVVGASTREDAIGFRVIRNLQRIGFDGAIFPINPRYREVAGLACLPNVGALPIDVDSAFIALPAAQGPETLEAVGRRGIETAFVNASGYADGGDEGRALQQRLRSVALAHGIALCGPNNMGLVNVHDRVAIWTQLRMGEMRPGPIAVISQSGSMALALAQDERKLGLAYVVTAGNEAVLSVADYVDFAAGDDRVRTIVLFLESIRGPAAFASAARRAHDLGKRIIAIKSGASVRARALVAAHTDSLAGDDDVYDAFFREHGVIRVRDLDEATEMAVLVTSYPNPPRTRGFVAVTLSGGEAALIADIASDFNLALPSLDASTIERLRPAFPPFAHPDNPLDAWGLGFDAQRFGQMLDALGHDPSIGAIGIAIDAPAAGGADTAYALAMVPHATRVVARGKQVIFFNNATGRGPNEDVRVALRAAGIPYLSGMRTSLWAIAKWLELREPKVERVPATTRSLPVAGSDWDRLLAQAGVPMVQTHVVSSALHAIEIADAAGYPVVLKARAESLPHKTEHRLVFVDLDSRDAVRAAYDELDRRLQRLANADAQAEIILQPMLRDGVELIVGIRNDSAFGTIVVVGPGGVLVELVDSAAVRLGPIDDEEAHAMLGETKAAALLAGFRGHPAYDVDAAAAAIVALSRFACAMSRSIESIEINPLVVLEHGAFGVDVLVRRSAWEQGVAVE
ncbi:MAG TPA: acetate--CoA ligase family protein [Casimicrobiaceae bacterium]|nr:acetate--CoA ligase family protein [Casimicrobiaceae bacterium]